MCFTSMMIFIRSRAREFGDVEDARELVEVEHRVVFAVLAVKGRILAEPHVFQIKGDEAAVAALDALTEF